MCLCAIHIRTTHFSAFQCVLDTAGGIIADYSHSIYNIEISTCHKVNDKANSNTGRVRCIATRFYTLNTILI